MRTCDTQPRNRACHPATHRRTGHSRDAAWTQRLSSRDDSAVFPREERSAEKRSRDRGNDVTGRPGGAVSFPNGWRRSRRSGRLGGVPSMTRMAIVERPSRARYHLSTVTRPCSPDVTRSGTVFLLAWNRCSRLDLRRSRVEDRIMNRP